MAFFGWRPYVSVAERRRRAQKEVARLAKKGRKIVPVAIEGRVIAKSFWGKAWCDNLESYSDYESRMPRGRTYVRNGSVVDLQIAAGKVTALVSGTEIYEIAISIARLPKPRWRSVIDACAGKIESVVDLLQGKLSPAILETLARRGTGLFPEPREIGLECTCPDWAFMCKHVAAALYGVGARLDAQPELFFTLRQVDQTELLAGAGAGGLVKPTAGRGAKLVDRDKLASVFGIELDEEEAPVVATTRGLGRKR